MYLVQLPARSSMGQICCILTPGGKVGTLIPIFWKGYTSSERSGNMPAGGEYSGVGGGGITAVCILPLHGNEKDWNYDAKSIAKKSEV